jgi:hypothetical protein
MLVVMILGRSGFVLGYGEASNSKKTGLRRIAAIEPCISFAVHTAKSWAEHTQMKTRFSG